jgi:hypothetical protein
MVNLRLNGTGMVTVLWVCTYREVPSQCAALVTLSPHTTQVKETYNPLKILFDYPTDIDVPSEEMNTFWRGGIENLEKEMEAYEILNSSEENSDGIHLKIPTMLVNSDNV